MADITNRFTDLTVKDRIVTAVFDSTDLAQVNLLRRAILSEIETYAIDLVIFHKNTSPRRDEVIALRLGQCVIDNMKFNTDDFRVAVKFQGPGEFTTNDIPEIPFADTMVTRDGKQFAEPTPIVTLKAGQVLDFEVIVKKGNGDIHVKWRPVATVGITALPDGRYRFRYTDIGMLSPEEVFRRGVEKIEAAAKRPAINIFFRHVVPKSL